MNLGQNTTGLRVKIDATQAQLGAAKVNTAMSSMRASAAGTHAAFRKVQLAVAGIGGFIALSITTKVLANFSEQMSQVKAISGATE